MKIAPSLLACDFKKLEAEVKEVAAAGADLLHLDVMDGVFVPNISFGLPVISSLRSCTNMLFDVHLMIVDPERYIHDFVDAGADLITIHYEACHDLTVALETVRLHSKMAGLSIKPNTPASAVFPYLEKCDMILVMSVEPGFGGQKLIPETLDKVREIKEEARRRGLQILVEVDGGIHEGNIKQVADAGADIAVAGSSVFGKADRRAAIAALKSF